MLPASLVHGASEAGSLRGPHRSLLPHGLRESRRRSERPLPFALYSHDVTSAIANCLASSQKCFK